MKTIGMSLASVAVAAASATAQLPQASAVALGLGDNVTASAQGFAAIANNPAGLGRATSPGFSLAVPGVSVELGLGPITLADLADVQGQVISTSQKDAWLERIATAGGQGGSVGAGATFALNIGPVGFQASTVAGGRLTLVPDAAELLLYGNAGRTGAAQDFDLTNSAIDGYVLSTAAMSLGFPVSSALSVGITGKYTIGNGLILGRDSGSFAAGSPVSVSVDFPVLLNPTNSPGFNHGTGFGVDVGAVWEGPALTVGATIQNVFNTFEWDLTGFSFIAAQAVFDQSQHDSNFDEQPASAAPAAFLQQAGAQKLKPVFAVGAEITPSSLLKIEADVRKRVAGGLELGPEYQAGVGAELHALSFLPLRAHVDVVTGGAQFGGGGSLVLGPVNLTAAVAKRTGGLQAATLGMFTLSFGGR
jgi:hypothetical protein